MDTLTIALFLHMAVLSIINAKPYYPNKSMLASGASPVKKKDKKKKDNYYSDTSDSMFTCDDLDFDCYDFVSGSDSGEWYTDETNESDKKKKKKKKRKKKKRPKNSNFVDLIGGIREKFALAAMFSRSSISMVCSPLSALFAAGILVFGAEGATLSELYRALGLRQSKKKISHFRQKTFTNISRRTAGLNKTIAVTINRRAKDTSIAHGELKKLRKRLQDISGVDVFVANRMYLSKVKKLRTGFREEAESVFHACTEIVDMKNPKQVASIINSWVKSTTAGSIPNFMRESDVPVEGSLVLVNGIHFKGKWKHPFRNIPNVQFHGKNGARSIPFMKVTASFRHGFSSKLDSQIIEIPYRKEAAALVIIMPQKRNGLDLLIQQLRLAPQLMNTITWEKKSMTIVLPRFKITSSLNLRPLYKMVDLSRIFRDHPSSGLKNIVRGETIFVDSSQQVASICICEDGTIAAAGTDIATGPIDEDRDLRNIIVCNQPFMYFIIWEKEQLFAGTFMDS